MARQAEAAMRYLILVALLMALAAGASAAGIWVGSVYCCH
jgi:hypothetical protein